MAKRGRRATNPKTIEMQLLKNPPDYIARRVADRRLNDARPWAEVIEDMDQYDKRFESRRKELQITIRQLEAICSRDDKNSRNKKIREALSAVEESKRRIAINSSEGGKIKSMLCQPAWHPEATRLAEEVKSSRAGIEVKLSDSQLAKFILGRWDQPAIKAPSHKTLRVYLGKSL